MSKTKAKSRGAKGASGAQKRKILGVTSDGVRILKPRSRATHFTRKELLAALATVRATNQN